MSDVWQGPGWWQASDGRWYPPEAVPSTAEVVPSTPEAFSSGPEAVAIAPEAFASGPEAVAIAPEAFASGPEVVTSRPEAVTSSPEAVETVAAGINHTGRAAQVGVQANGGWPGRFDRPAPLPRNLAEVLTLVLLVAALVRLVAAVAGAVIGWTRFPGQTHGQQVGTSLLVGGGFADGQGALLLAVALGLLWWQTYVWHRGAQAAQRLERMRWGLRWLFTLAVATAAGSVVYAVGIVFYYAGSGSGRVVWEHFIGSGGFAVAYAVISGGVAFTTRRLLDDVPVVDRNVAPPQTV